MRRLAAVRVPGRPGALASLTDSMSVSLERLPRRAEPGAAAHGNCPVEVARRAVHCLRRRSTPWPTANGCWPLRLVPRPLPSCPSDLRRSPWSPVFSPDRGAEVTAKRSWRHTYNLLTGRGMCLCQNRPVGQCFERREGRRGANPCEKGSVTASPGTGRMARRPARRGAPRKTKRPTERGWPFWVVVEAERMTKRHVALGRKCADFIAPMGGRSRAPISSAFSALARVRDTGTAPVPESVGGVFPPQAHLVSRSACNVVPLALPNSGCGGSVPAQGLPAWGEDVFRGGAEADSLT